MALDQYIYISRSKLAAYLPQVLEDAFFRKEGEKLSVELGFDLLGVKGKIALEQQPAKSVVSIARLVEKYIAKDIKPGDVDSGRDWITGEMGVKFIRLGNNKDIFALVGKYQDCVILLVGSQSNCQFSDTAQSINTGFSHFHAIEEVLMNSWVEIAENRSEEHLKLYLPMVSRTENINGSSLGDFEMAAEIYEMFHIAKSTQFRVKFLARRLFFALSTRSGAKTCAMYSPLYVIHE